MKKKTLISRMISFVLIIAFVSYILLPQYMVVAQNNSCDSCTIGSKPQIESMDLDDYGNLVKRFDTGVEVIYYRNGEIIINDYTHVFTNKVETTSEYRIAGETVIGIVSIIYGACGIVELIHPHHLNPCKVIVDYVYAGTGGPPDGKYEVYATYVPGYIPGCEPRHSAPCNAGYYRYRTVKIG
jgi:hypothetical protein